MTVVSAPAAIDPLMTASTSASVSVGNLLTATTTGIPESLGVANVGGQISHARFQQRNIFLGIRLVQRASSYDARSAAVHLQGADGSHQHHAVGEQTRITALDVENFSMPMSAPKPDSVTT